MLARGQLLLILIAVSGGPGNSFAREGDVIDQMLARWKKNQIESVRYEFEGKRTIPAGSLEAPLWVPEGVDLGPQMVPAADYPIPIRCELIVDFQHQRLRIDEWAEDFQMDDATFYKCREIHLFDGTELQRYEPRSDNPRMQREEAKYAAELTMNPYTPSGVLLRKRQFAPLGALLSLGILPGGAGNWPTPQQLVPTPSRESFRWVRDETYRDATCAVVYMPPRQGLGSYQFWVSRQQPGQIVRCSHYYGDDLLWTLELHYDGENLARTTRWALDPKGELRMVEEMTVKSTTVNPPLDDVVFHMEPAVGMVYRDGRVDQRLLIPREGEPAVDVKILYAREREEQERTP